MPRNYHNSFPAYVGMKVGAITYKYGFKCRLQGKATAINELGIVEMNEGTIALPLLQYFILGCNQPKPPRATKLSSNAQHGYESSFVSAEKIASAKVAGWKITPGKPPRKPLVTPRSQTVYVTVNGVKYAWQFPKVSDAVSGQVDIASVGVKLATAGDDDLVFGCSFPKPRRAGKIINDPGDDQPDNFSTFVDIETLPEGWYPINDKKSNKLSAADLLAMI